MVPNSADDAEDLRAKFVERLDDIWQGAAVILALERHGARQAEEIRDLQQVLVVLSKAARRCSSFYSSSLDCSISCGPCFCGKVHAIVHFLPRQ